MIPLQFALRRRMMIKRDSKIEFEFEYTGDYTDNRDKNGKGTVRFTSKGTLTVLSGTNTVSAYILGAGGGGLYVEGWSDRSASGGGGGFQTVDVELSPGTYAIVIGKGGAGRYAPKSSQSSSPAGGNGGKTTAFGYTSTGGNGGKLDGKTYNAVAGRGGSPNGSSGSVGRGRGGSPNGGASSHTTAADNSGGDGYVAITFS